MSAPTTNVAAIAAVLIVGVAKGGLGGGVAVVGVPLMAMVVSPVQAAAIMLPILMVMDVLALRVYWGQWDPGSLRLLLPAALLLLLPLLLLQLLELFGGEPRPRRARALSPPVPAAGRGGRC